MALILSGGKAKYLKWYLYATYNQGVDLLATFTDAGDTMQWHTGWTCTDNGLTITTAARGTNVNVTFNKAVNVKILNTSSGTVTERTLAANETYQGQELYSEYMIVELA